MAIFSEQTVLVFTLAVMCFLGGGAAVRGGRLPLPDEQRLLKKVFTRNYDNSIRPVFNATDSVMVHFGLTLIQIMDMDEKNQVLVTNVWLEHVWVDQRIRWNPDDFSGLRVVRVPPSKIWLPDIVLYNNADDYTSGYMPSKAMISYDGTVFWSPPARMRSSCKVDITFFPFDKQICKMKFGSWTYDQAQVDIANKSELIDLSNYITNGEWYLLDTRIVRNEVVYPIGDEVYPDVTVIFHIQRRVLYYILNIIFPCVWLNILSLLAFCLPPDAGEKITLGITVLLSYSVFMLLVAENMPPTSEFVPLIGIYLTVSMAVTSISVILTVFVLKIHHGKPHQREIPGWVRTLVLKYIARIVRSSCSSQPTNKKRRPSKGKTKLANENTDICLRLINDGVHLNSLKRTQLNDTRPNSVHKRESFSDTSNSDANEQKRMAILEEILKYLKIMVARRDAEDMENDIMKEWRQVALVMDRFLFVCFLSTVAITTVVNLVIYPLFFDESSI